MMTRSIEKFLGSRDHGLGLDDTRLVVPCLLEMDSPRDYVSSVTEQNKGPALI